MATSVVVPQLGESVVEARVAKWLKKPGDPVMAGEPLVELETEKIDLEVGAEAGGVLAEILRGEGEDVKVGEVLAIIGSATASEPVPPSPAAAAVDGEPARDMQRATPAARKMAAEHAVDLAAVPPTGEAGRILRRDVEAFLSQRGSEAPSTPPGPVAAPALAASETAPAPPPGVPPMQAPATAPAPAATPPPAPGERIEERQRMSKRRLTIARNLVEAQRTGALLTTFNEIDMSAVMSLRERRKEAFRQAHGVGLGIASFFVKASVVALKAFPRLNAEIQGDEIVLKRYYDIGVAVGAPQGLVVPVIRDADRRSFAAIELAIRDFAKRAHDGTLTLDDLRGGTFTITNGGVFGSLLSTPIINPPQVGILGLHKIEDRPVAVSGRVEVRPMMYVALTYDHRIVDGLEAVQFLVRIKELIEDPGHLLLES